MDRQEFNSIIKSNKGFYIGDICYVLSEAVYQGIWGRKNFIDGEINVPELSNFFAVGSTNFGDGLYYDQFNHSYSVDAGVIGCVPDELLDKEQIIKDYSYRSDDENLIDIINSMGLYVEGDTAEFYSSGDGEFVVTVKKNNKVVKSIHINTKDCEFEDDDLDWN